MASLEIVPDHITGGDTAVGKVTLEAPAPAGGVVVHLESSSAVAMVPSNAVIAAGSTSETFTVPTEVVRHDTAAIISASIDRSNSKHAKIRIGGDPNSVPVVHVVSGTTAYVGTAWPSPPANATSFDFSYSDDGDGLTPDPNTTSSTDASTFDNDIGASSTNESQVVYSDCPADTYTVTLTCKVTLSTGTTEDWTGSTRFSIS